MHCSLLVKPTTTELENAVVFVPRPYRPLPLHRYFVYCANISSNLSPIFLYKNLQNPLLSLTIPVSSALSRNTHSKMASLSVPCPKVSPPLAASSQPFQKSQSVASFPRSECRLVPPSILAKLKVQFNTLWFLI